MAGEMEEPISFQTSSLHSGSISFGKFDSESLSWERRSSFSHNRYLEEVEKYSKPGSVTEKKAYFEAHFKKKALMRQSTECHEGMEDQTTENYMLGKTIYLEEFQHDNKGNHSSNDDESTEGSDDHGEFEVIDYEREDEEISDPECETDPSSIDATVMLKRNEDLQHAEPGGLHQIEVKSDTIQFVKGESEFEEWQKLGDDHGEFGVMDYEREDEEISDPECQSQPSSIDATVMLNRNEDLQHVELAGLHQMELESDTIQLVKGESEFEERQKLGDEVDNVDGLTKDDQSSQSQTSAKEHTLSMKNLQKPTPKGMAESKMRTSKTKCLTQVPRKTARNPSKDCPKNPRSVRSENVLKNKAEKQSPQKVSPVILSRPGTSKTEDPRSRKSKSVQEKKSEKVERAKNVGTVSQPLMSDKADSKSHQTASRPRQAAVSSKPELKPSAAVFSFKSDERAEKRKEFYMKLEEKMHAKEAEMNQIQTKSQEEKEAEMKQFRRSLNFKATPLPSFYHEVVSRGSKNKKATAAHAKSTNSLRKCTSPAGRASSKSPASSKSVCHQAPTVDESDRKAAPLNISEATSVPPEASNSSTTASINKKITLQSGKRDEAIVKKEKFKETAIQKHEVKHENIDGKRIVGGNGGSKMIRKMMMKGMTSGSLSVDVAS